ncbi:MAG: hypothetical protein ACXWW7_14385 [Nocardioides sp.]
MSTTTEQLVAEVGLPPELVADLEPVVSGLRDLVADEPPTPSAALAALLADPPRIDVPRSRRRLLVVGSAAAVLTSLTVTGMAAAANELPNPAQRLVAQLSERYLPFHFPQPRNGATKVDPDEIPDRVAPTDPGTYPDPTAPVGSPTSTGDPSGPPTPSEVPSGRPSKPGASPSAPGTPSGEPAASGAPSGAPSAQPTGTLAPAPGESEADLTESDPRVGTDPDAEPTAEPSAPASSAGSDPTADPTTDPTFDPTAHASDEPTGAGTPTG